MLSRIPWRQARTIIITAWPVVVALEAEDIPGKDKLKRVLDLVFPLIPEDRWLVAEELTRFVVEAALLYTRLRTALATK